MNRFRHFLIGIGYGIPLCCVLRFCWDNPRSGSSPAEKRGVCYGPNGEYVPCGIRHHRTDLISLDYALLAYDLDQIWQS